MDISPTKQLRRRRTLSQSPLHEHTESTSILSSKKSASTSNLAFKKKPDQQQQQHTTEPTDLEWDKHLDFNTKFIIESPTVSACDLTDQMAARDIFKPTFLDFEFNSRTASNCSISMAGYSADVQDLCRTRLTTIENYCLRSPMHYKPFIYHPITFDDSNECPTIVHQVNSFYRSMPDIRMLGAYNKSADFLYVSNLSNTRHMSLLGLDCLELVDFNKNLKPNTNQLKKAMKLDLTPSYTVIRENARKMSESGSSVNFSSMSRLSKLRSYVSDISEKIVNIISATFSLGNRTNKFNNASDGGGGQRKSGLFTIGEECVETYDVIEVGDILRTPSATSRDMIEQNVNT